MSGEWKTSGVCRYRATPRLYSFFGSLKLFLDGIHGMSAVTGERLW